MHVATKRMLSGCAGLMLAMAVIPAQADPTSPFTGLRLSQGRADMRGIPNDTTVGGAISVGVETPDYRLTLDLVRHGYDEAEARGCIFNYDRLHPINNRLTVFAGVHGGVADLEPGSPDFRNKSYASGFAGGAQAGMMIRLIRNVRLEAGVRHSRFRIRTFSKVHDRDVRLNHQTESFLALNLTTTRLAPSRKGQQLE